MTTKARPAATLSLDLDDLWAYMRVHGDAGWDRFPTFFDRAVPRMLDVLGSRGLTITVFIVGQDAALDRNREIMARIAAAGHDIGNHSFHHRPSLAAGTFQDIDHEVAQAEDAIDRATGSRPMGFRGPGFSLSSDLLRVLSRRGYLYDASTFPTFLGPLARLYYQATVRTQAAGAEERENLYGQWRDGLRPLNPYLWNLPEGSLLEIPVTTFPLARVPFHMTYLLHLASKAPWLARRYLQTALSACRLSATTPSFLLHALDFLGADDVPPLAFFPGMNLSGARKSAFVGDVLDMLRTDFEPMSMRQYVRSLEPVWQTLPSRVF